MKKIVVASKNPVKMAAALGGFEKMFPGEKFEVVGVSVPSDVSDQPQNEQETLTGALNRAANAAQENPEADFCIGLEGGIEQKGSEMEAFAWIVVRSKDGKTGKFFLPPPVAALVAQGKELGEADDIVFGMTNSKQANGAIGILTKDVFTRTSFYIQAVVLALIPFKNEHLYF